MSSLLLLLPREIRDLIMLEAMTLRAPAATRAYRTIPPAGTDGQQYLWSEDSSWQDLNLLAVSRQVRAEAQDLIAQLHNSHNIRFELDILANGYVYTPTWTLRNLALRPRSALDVQVHLRIVSTEAFQASNNDNAGPSQPGHVYTTLLSFLSRFLYLGPTFLHVDPAFQTRGPFYLNNLILHVTFQDHYTRATHAGTVREIFRMVKALSRLETASRYIGRIRVDAEWQVQGEDFRWEREWDLKKVAETSSESGTEKLKEEDWAAFGLPFGEAWVRRYGGHLGLTA